MKSYKEFYNTHNGKGWDTDSYGSFQCMDLWMEWFIYMFGYNPPPQGSAYMVWNNRNQIFSSLMDKVSFHLDNPRQGDVVVYGANIPNLTGTHGHIAIFDHAPMNLFTQNFACNKLNGNGDPLCPAQVKNHGSSKPLGYIRFNEIQENTGEIPVSQPTEVPLQPNQGVIMHDTNLREQPNTQSRVIDTLNSQTIDCLSIVKGEAFEGNDLWVQVNGGYIHYSRFSTLPKLEVAQTPTPSVETPPEVPQHDIPTSPRRNVKDLVGIRARTQPNFDNNIYAEFNGAGKSVNVLAIVDGADYNGSIKWVKYMYSDLQIDDRANMEVYSHESFFN